MAGANSVADVWEATAAKGPQNPCLIHAGDEQFPGRTLTFAQVDAMANQIAHWFV